MGGNKQAGEPSKPEQAAKPAASAPVASAESKKDKLTLDEGWAIDKSDGFAVYVNGYVSNNIDKPITNYVQITFTALDAKGANVGDCLANTNTVDANGKWKFRAMCTGEFKDISKVRFKDITGF